MYDYYIQMNLQTINGNSLKHILHKTQKPKEVFHHDPNNDFRTSTINVKNKQPIAMIFFRFSHRSKDNKALTNKEQRALCDEIFGKMIFYMNMLEGEPKSSKISSTFL